MHIEGNAFIVSGGAGGLGEQVVRSIVAQGGYAAIFDLNQERAEVLADELGEQVYYPGPVDVTSENRVKEAMASTITYFGKAPLVGGVLCSGILLPPAHQEGYGPDKRLTSIGQFKHIMEINVFGTYNIAQCLAEHLISRKPVNHEGERGVLITTTSILGLDGTLLAYGTSKAAVAGMTLPLARELADYGIRVMSIAPGPFETPMTQSTPITAPPCLFPQRHGHPQEFADLALYIIRNPMLNGSVVRLDGGLRA